MSTSGAEPMQQPSHSVPKTERDSLAASPVIPIAYNRAAHPVGGSSGPTLAAVRTCARSARSRRAVRSKPTSPRRLPHRMDHRAVRRAQLRLPARRGDLRGSRSASGKGLARDCRTAEGFAGSVVRSVLSLGGIQPAAEKTSSFRGACRERASRVIAA